MLAVIRDQDDGTAVVTFHHDYAGLPAYKRDVFNSVDDAMADYNFTWGSPALNDAADVVAVYYSDS